MTAEELLRRLGETIDAHAWDDLPALLHPQFTCTIVHTGEVFDRESWVAFNAGYPGFQRMVLEETLGSGDRAAGRAHVTGLDADGDEHRFALATFVTARDGLLLSAVEVWTDLDQVPPPGKR